MMQGKSSASSGRAHREVSHPFDRRAEPLPSGGGGPGPPRRVLITSRLISAGRSAELGRQAAEVLRAKRGPTVAPLDREAIRVSLLQPVPCALLCLLRLVGGRM